MATWVQKGTDPTLVGSYIITGNASVALVSFSAMYYTCVKVCEMLAKIWRAIQCYSVVYSGTETMFCRPLVLGERPTGRPTVRPRVTLLKNLKLSVHVSGVRAPTKEHVPVKLSLCRREVQQYIHILTNVMYIY